MNTFSMAEAIESLSRLQAQGFGSVHFVVTNGQIVEISETIRKRKSQQCGGASRAPPALIPP